MDHATIEENGFVERYHQGLLTPEEEIQFEEHFVACAECTEQLEFARGFQRGLKAMVAEDAARAVVVQAGVFAWLARRGRLARWGLALAVLLAAAALPFLWFLARNQSAQRTMAEWRQRWEGERRTAADLERRLAESERRRQEERRELESRLAQATPPETPRGLAGPVADAAVFLLTAVRGEAGEPATLDLSRTGEIVSLAVDVGDDPRIASYRVTLTGPGNKTLFRQGGLKPNALEVLMITFPSSFFAPGEYRLRVEGVEADGGVSEVGGYAFRVGERKPSP